VTSILPHNIVNDTPWHGERSVGWWCYPTGWRRVDLRFVSHNEYRVYTPAMSVIEFTAESVPAAKAEALRLVREAILAEAEAWK
jgi:hypothetical protein